MAVMEGAGDIPGFRVPIEGDQGGKVAGVDADLLAFIPDGYQGERCARRRSAELNGPAWRVLGGHPSLWWGSVKPDGAAGTAKGLPWVGLQQCRQSVAMHCVVYAAASVVGFTTNTKFRRLRFRSFRS